MHQRMKQGNEQLNLWIKRCKNILDKYNTEFLKKGGQQPITNWIDTWDNRERNIHEILTDDDDSVIQEINNDTTTNTAQEDTGRQPDIGQQQTTISEWLKSWADIKDNG